MLLHLSGRLQFFNLFRSLEMKLFQVFLFHLLTETLNSQSFHQILDIGHLLNQLVVFVFCNTQTGR